MPANESRRKSILRIIANFTSSKGYPPALAEIAQLLRVSVHTIYYYVRVFIRLGFINHQPHKPRDLRVTEAGRVYASVAE